MRITKIVVIVFAIATIACEDEPVKQKGVENETVDDGWHETYVGVSQMILKCEQLDYTIEMVNKPGTQNGAAITFKTGKRRIEVDEDWYGMLPTGKIWGMVFVVGHEIGHFYWQDRQEEAERTANKEQQQLAADYFAGHVSAKIGLTQEEALWVLKDFQHHDPEGEDWEARMLAVENGWAVGNAGEPLPSEFEGFHSEPFPDTQNSCSGAAQSRQGRQSRLFIVDGEDRSRR